MTPGQVDRFLRAIDGLAKEMGGRLSFEQGLQIIRGIVAGIHESLQKVNSRELLAQQLASDIPNEWWDLFINLGQFMPEFLQHGATVIAKSISETHPPAKTGRSAVPAEKQVEMIKYVLLLYGDKKVPLKVAKSRAAAKFGWSIRTVNRYWSQRDRILEFGPEIRFSDVLATIRQKWEADRIIGRALF